MEVSRKVKSAGAGAGGRDRLSDLPDCLLHAVLSRLGARQVVQTCALSRRWRGLWLTAPCLDIHSGEFLSPGADDAKEDGEDFGAFEDFADSLLVHRGARGLPPLDALRLRVPPWGVPSPWHRFDRSYPTRYTRWVRGGLKCSPAELDVGGLLRLPPLLAPGTRRLTKLRLDHVLLHQDFEEHLNSGLPVLEELEIIGTDLSGLSKIASSTLRNLVVDYSQLNGHGDLAFVVSAPRLVSLHLVIQFRYLGCFGVAVDGTPTSLARASIRLVDKPQLRLKQGALYYIQQDKDLLRALCKLLGSLSNVGALNLSGFQDMTVAEHYVPYLLQPSPSDEFPRPLLQAMLDEEHDGLPMFCSLKTLVLDGCEIGNKAQTLWRFLCNTPVLEKLTLKNCECQKFPTGSETEEREDKYKSEIPPTILEMEGVYFNLKLVELIYKHRDDPEPGGKLRYCINQRGFVLDKRETIPDYHDSSYQTWKKLVLSCIEFRGILRLSPIFCF